MTDEVEEFFTKPAGAPSFKFNGVGSGLKGTVVSTQIMDQTQFGTDLPALDKHGNVKKQLQIILQTDLRNFDKTTEKAKVDQDGKPRDPSEDDGKRAIYVKNQMVDAIREAVEVHGLKKVEVGGELAVKLSGTKPTNKGNPQNLYEARYTPGAPPSDGDGFFNEGSEATSPAAEQSDEPPF